MVLTDAIMTIAAAMRIAHSATVGSWCLVSAVRASVRFVGNQGRTCELLSHDHNGEVGTMRWKVTIDADDMLLAIAMIVTAVAISLALM
jgi:hypothetical protein